jgi:ubiquinone biosynthesis protein
MILLRIPRICLRLGHILWVIIKYIILGTFVDLIFFIYHKIVSRDKAEFTFRSFARKKRQCIEELFPTFIKLGQWLSMRPEYASNEMIEELNKLQDELPSLPFKTMKKILKRELKKDLHEIFLSFDEKPISTASIAQVHKAILRSNNEPVAVKIQRLKLKKLIDIDMDIFNIFFTVVGYFSQSLPVSAFKDMLGEFRRYLYQEIDFINEAQNMEHLTSDMKNFPYIKIAKVYWDWTTKQVLTMEFLDGLKPKGEELKKYEDRGLDRKALCYRGADAIFAQIFEYGFFHCDPHPANILALRGNVIAFIDCAMIGKFDKKLKNSVMDFFYYIIKRNIDGFQRVLLDIANIYAPINIHSFSADCQEFIDRMHYISSGRIDFSKVIYSLNNLIYRNKLSLPPSFLFMIKAMLTIEGVARSLYSEFDWRDHVEPILERMLKKRITCKKVTQDLKDTILELLPLIPKLPRKLSNLLDLVPNNGGDDPLTELGRAFRMFSVSLFFAAALIASILLEAGPTIITIMIIAGIGIFLRLVRRLY